MSFNDYLLDYFSHEEEQGMSNETMELLSDCYYRLKQENEKLRCNSNCKYGGGNRCEYPNAEYTNCHTACNQWEFNGYAPVETRDIKIKQ